MPGIGVAFALPVNLKHWHSDVVIANIVGKVAGLTEIFKVSNEI
jgi:hypothetical protein